MSTIFDDLALGNSVALMRRSFVQFPIRCKISVSQHLKLLVLDTEAPGSIPSRSNLGNEVSCVSSGILSSETRVIVTLMLLVTYNFTASVAEWLPC